jgi:hypothetical protein
MRLTLLLMLLLSTTLGAQGPERSASRELLDRARGALSDLRFRQADSTAREVLTLTGLSRSARIEALQIIAAANLPESPADRRETLARSAISQLLQIDLSLAIPRDIASPALDSLYRDVSTSTFATSVYVRRENPINGLAGAAPLRVRSNAAAAFALRMRTKDGIESFLLDSVSSATDTTLSLRVARDATVLFRGGEYDLVVTATVPTTGQSIVKVFDAVAIVPGIEFLSVPSTIDSTLLKPERSRSERTVGLVAGLLVGAATVAIGSGLRAPDPVRGQGSRDSRYLAAGVVMGLGTMAAAWFDRGYILDKGLASNRRALNELSTRQRAAREENQRRIDGYRASITVNPEAR